MKKIIDFLIQLQQNNRREWFQTHRDEYLHAQAIFNEFIDKLIQGIGGFDPTIQGLTAKDCIYRIYRDTRFSTDKTPYKGHFGAYIVRGGKKSGYVGYYIQVGTEEYGYPNGSMLAAGDYCYDAKVLRTLREDIYNGEGDFERIVKQAAPFVIDTSDMLKRNPTGFPVDAPYSEYLRLRNPCLIYEPGNRYICSTDFLEKCTEAFRATHPFIEYINRAISFTKERN